MQGAAYEIALRDRTLAKPLLAAAAPAELKHFTAFSAPVTSVTRPRSDYLGGYFAQVSRLADK